MIAYLLGPYRLGLHGVSPKTIIGDITVVGDFQLMASAFDDYALYHQTKTPIGFWCRRGLNPKSLIQPSETLPVVLIRYTLIIYREMELQHYRHEHPLDFNKAKGIGLLCSMVGKGGICTPNVSVGNTKKCLCYGCLERVLGPRSRKYLAIRSQNQQQTQPTITNQTNQPTNPAIQNPHEHIKPPSTTTATDQSIKPPQPTPTTDPFNNPPPPTIGPTTTSQPLIQERALEIFPYLQSERGTSEL
ncbi:hypothetical protein SO802_008792 [Lithocarpus litseifolius]|uniref:Uncharacterized protein n=1 Tax=Lithocarpus litseifolius TaxID=425828 RepID=A0AAW2D9L9_9ROSI